jgi:hypothetical protein
VAYISWDYAIEVAKFGAGTGVREAQLSGHDPRIERAIKRAGAAP